MAIWAYWRRGTTRRRRRTIRCCLGGSWRRWLGEGEEENRGLLEGGVFTFSRQVVCLFTSGGLEEGGLLEEGEGKGKEGRGAAAAVAGDVGFNASGKDESWHAVICGN
jgi:hypothetical protein